MDVPSFPSIIEDDAEKRSCNQKDDFFASSFPGERYDSSSLTSRNSLIWVNIWRNALSVSGGS